LFDGSRTSIILRISLTLPCRSRDYPELKTVCYRPDLIPGRPRCRSCL
jgi:hypothetical protein